MKRDDNGNDALGRQLREAGAALTPATSEPLHVRVMADVRRDRAVASSIVTARSTATGWWMISAAAAAAAIAVGVGVWRNASPEPAERPVAHVNDMPLPPMPSLEKVVVMKVSPMREKLHEARFGYLDRDSKRLARFLIRAVPGVPSQAKEEATRGL